MSPAYARTGQAKKRKRLFINKLNKRGPKLELWGTPELGENLTTM